MSPHFSGFNEPSSDDVPVAAVFFSDLLPKIDDLNELRLCLYAFWLFSRDPSDPGFMRFSAVLEDVTFSALFGESAENRQAGLADAFSRSCQRGVLLEVVRDEDRYYFLNSPRGKAASEGLRAGRWEPDDGHYQVTLDSERPNIFTLYEQNIGPLTPLIAEELKEAESTYPVDWVAEAIKIAVTRNARNWRFVEAVLKTWKEKGRHGTDRRSAEEDRKRDSEGQFRDFIKH